MSRIQTDPTIPTDQDARLAQQVASAIDQSKAAGHGLRVQIDKAGREVTTLELPPAVAKLLVQILDEVGKGHAVTVVPSETELTTQQAADLLNVSRPFVVGMIEKGQLAARMVGNQRRLPLKDVLAYKKDNEARRSAALDELAKLDQELGLR